MTAIEGNFAYSFLLGVLAAVNPCGFVLLPTYLVYYLGLDTPADDTRAVALGRSLKVGAAVSAGFVSLFLVVGSVTRLFTDVITRNAKYLSLVIGIALMVAGIAMLRGWKPRIVTPDVGSRRDRTVRSMFVFGVAYAIASIGCTIGFLVSVILGSVGRNGFVSGVVSVVLYGLGMGLLVTALTVAIALARTGFVGFLRGGLRWFDTVSAVLVTLTGAYLTWYWWGAISERGGDSVVRRVDGWQTSVASFLQDVGAGRLALVLVAVVGAALLVVLGRRREGSA